MKQLLVRLIVLLLLAVPVTGVTAPDASACSHVPRFEITTDDLVAPDLNQPGSDLLQRYVDNAWGNHEEFTIEGAYVFQSVGILEGSGDWTRDSVLAPIQSWGETPRLTAWASGGGYDDPDSPCPTALGGPQLGFQGIRLVVSPAETLSFLDFSYRGDDEVALAALTEAFGPATSIERDTAEEARLLSIREDLRPNDSLPEPKAEQASQVLEVPEDERANKLASGPDDEQLSRSLLAVISLAVVALAAGGVALTRRNHNEMAPSTVEQF